MNKVKEAIREKARALGFDAVGFCSADTNHRRKSDLAAFLALGRHGDMAWMADTAKRRAAPKALWPEACGIVVLGMNYGPASDPLAGLRRRRRGMVSVYAQGADYHSFIKKRLKQLARWMCERHGGQVKVFVDTAPVMEKPLAASAGLGWQGKHSNLVSRDFGSWLFLAEVFTTLELPADDPATDLCGSCNRCREACPTEALSEPYRIDASRCISYLTIENKGTIPDPLKEKMGNRIFGCDDCLAVCPWNKYALPTHHDRFFPRPQATAPRLADLANLDDAAFCEIFAGSPIKRLGHDRLLRNLLIAAGNSGEAGLAKTANGHLDSPSPLVREAAAWAFERLRKKSSPSPR
ncbi:MAG TPA: tRNA epoxyqueuosine(34) reductase QueG [Rhodospirillales bacterium]|jgi:epoxyqueuosine reductase|nr:tRNA epoxyqueuosine(34) reductase QueG [Rhodospirillales bacterium]